RIGVGIGRVGGRIVAPVNQLDGHAFRFARQAIESLKQAGVRNRPALTAFRTETPSFDSTVNLIYALQDTLLEKMTEKQWATVAARIDSRTLNAAARALRLDVSTVSRNLKRGYYGQLLAVASGAEKLIHAAF
ncbi:MAG: hypothetical protein WAL82_08575, partial [Candidatus Acidiferrales bacterium]